LLTDTKKAGIPSDPFDKLSVQLNGLGHAGTFSGNIRAARESEFLGIDGIAMQ
jgi:hypothetical protein